MKKKVFPAALFITGLILLYFGYDEYHSFQSEFERFFGGSGSDDAIMMLVLGAAATIGGFVGLLRGKS